jgi:hypothetical protein
MISNCESNQYHIFIYCSYVSFLKIPPHCTPSICIHVRFAGDGRAWVIQGAVDDVASAVPWQAGWNDPGNTDPF